MSDLNPSSVYQSLPCLSLVLMQAIKLENVYTNFFFFFKLITYNLIGLPLNMTTMLKLAMLWDGIAIYVTS